METISTDTQYKNAIARIHFLTELNELQMGTEMHQEISKLSRMAAAYEQVKYDLSFMLSQADQGGLILAAHS